MAQILVVAMRSDTSPVMGLLKDSGHEVAFAPGFEPAIRKLDQIAPDLLVYFGDLLWRSVGQVGTGRVHVFENDTGPDDANHAHEGLYVLAAEDGPNGPGPERDLRDVAPTILQLLGEPVPADMEGVSMLASAHV